jgi:CMP/dCMP kinase
MPIVIAIDGHSSCGKSTLAKALAQSLGFAYGDSGAMYRAVTLYFLENYVDYGNDESIAVALGEISIHFERINGQNHTFLNGKDVEHDIRTLRIGDHVSPVSTISAVRRAMVKQQQAMGYQHNLVMDGRDIGTVVYPNADLKIFLTADIDVRTSRRHLELAAKGIDAEWDDVRINLSERDLIDSTRSDSPLRQAADAIVLNNTLLSEAEQLEKVMDLVREKIPQLQP